MKTKFENTLFINYCRNLYYDNIDERSEVGEVPYENFNAYFTKNYDFLVMKYKEQYPTHIFNE
tara:strand:+ start:1093 stop:1281 length:189 start_codon:yes stop_codon:yes gene_type:complete